ncbi:Response regulator PleD [bacterium HR40]|nr:Response regulator PleD [bacterium HR40]
MDLSETAVLLRSIEQERTLNTILRIAVRDDPLPALLHACLQALLGVSWLSLLPKGGVFLAEPESQQLHLVAHINLGDSLLRSCIRVPFGRCLCGLAAATRQLQFASEVDHRHVTRYPGIAPHGHYNVPIVQGEEVLGVLVLYLPEGHIADPGEQDFLLAVADVLALAIRNRRVREELERTCQKLATLAITDPLTGLLNRRAFFDELERVWAEAVRLDRPLALLMCDIDHFKSVNDTYGHHGGDEALRTVALVLRAGTRAYDIVARLGGEEFAVLFPGTGLEDAATIGERLRAGIASTPAVCEGREILLTASFGVACRRPASEPGELVRRCDHALYAAKRRGRNCVVCA